MRIPTNSCQHCPIDYYSALFSLCPNVMKRMSVACVYMCIYIYAISQFMSNITILKRLVSLLSQKRYSSQSVSSTRLYKCAKVFIRIKMTQFTDESATISEEMTESVEKSTQPSVTPLYTMQKHSTAPPPVMRTVNIFLFKCKKSLLTLPYMVTSSCSDKVYKPRGTDQM